MSNKRTMLNLGLCAILALAMAGAANATMVCPVPVCTGAVPQQCLGGVTSDNGPITCTQVGTGVDVSSCTASGTNPVTLIATHDHLGAGPHDHPTDPASCVWSCVDNDGDAFKQFCGISAINSDLPVTLFSFSVGGDTEGESESGDEEPTTEDNQG